MMETIKQTGGKIMESLADYAELSVQIAALKTADKGAKITSGFFTVVILTIVFLFSLLLISIGAALLISFAMHHLWAGFFIVGAFYTLLGIVLIVLRQKLITKPLLNQIIPALVNIAEKAGETIEKAQDKIEDKLKLEKQPD